METLQQIKVKEIKAGRRHRKDFGDLKSLALSIREEGLLQPVGVTKDMKLVFGERRLRAIRDVLKRKTILARIVDVTSIVAGEFTENEIRKDFTPSERVAIAKAIEKQMPERRGKRQNFDGFNGRSDAIAAKRSGFGNRQTYRQAQKVLKNGSSKLILAMDQGRVSISAAALFADADISEQDAVLELDEKAILQAAREIRQRDTDNRNRRNSSPAKPKLSKAKRTKATKLIHGDCLKVMPKLRANSVDAIISDPIYAEVSREYGRISEAKWHDLMQAVVIESRRVLKPTGSAVFIFQPNYEKIVKMRIWLWEFLVWAAKEWNLIQDCYWWATDAMPLAGSHRKQGLMRQSVKMCIRRDSSDADDIARNLHHKVFDIIDCTKCANCCKVYRPQFSVEEIDRIADYLEISPIEVIDKLLEESNAGMPHHTHQTRQLPCPFLREDGRCGVYEVRPDDCRNFPSTDKGDISQHKHALSTNARNCPAAYYVVEGLREQMGETFELTVPVIMHWEYFDVGSGFITCTVCGTEYDEDVTLCFPCDMTAEQEETITRSWDVDPYSDFLVCETCRAGMDAITWLEKWN